MQVIAQLLSRHNGQSAWVFGKGPGLDKFDMTRAGVLRICINESLLRVPLPTYFFAHDEVPIRRVATGWPASCLAILQKERAQLAQKLGIPDAQVYVYEKRQDDWATLRWPAEKIAQHNALFGMTGTVHSALHFCRLIGARDLHLVGMEGSGGYASCLGIAPPPGGGQHDLIRRHSIKAANQLDLELLFEE